MTYTRTPTAAEISAFVGLDRAAGSHCHLHGEHSRIVELRPDRLHPADALPAGVIPSDSPAVVGVSAPCLRPTGRHNPVERRFDLTPSYRRFAHGLKRVRPLDLRQFRKGGA